MSAGICPCSIGIRHKSYHLQMVFYPGGVSPAHSFNIVILGISEPNIIFGIMYAIIKFGTQLFILYLNNYTL